MRLAADDATVVEFLADADELEELLMALDFAVVVLVGLDDPWSLSVLSDTLDFDPGPLELLFDDPRTSL